MEALSFHDYLRVRYARSLIERGGGLLVRPPLRQNEALYLAPCASVHTFFMRYPIDAAFVDRRGCILKIVTMVPWRVAGCLRAYGVLALRAHQARRLGVTVGTILSELADAEDRTPT